MAYVWSLGTAVPPHALSAAEMKRLGRGLLGPLFPDPSRLDEMVDNSRIERRHLVRPAGELGRSRAVDETAAACAEAARDLARRALAAALDAGGVAPAEVDALVLTTSSAGCVVPSLDNYLLQDLGFRTSTRRYPYTTFACAGGAAGLARAAEVAGALGPGATVALVAVETLSLLFRQRDVSRKNAIASLLFGDGAAAAILRDRAPRGRPSVRVAGARSWLQPDAYHAMGLRPRPDGFDVTLDAAVPELSTRGLARELEALLAGRGATPTDLAFMVLHPGGCRVVEAVERALRLPPGWTAPAWEVLRAHGNMSSATVLFVLEEHLRRGLPAAGSLGVLVAFGPGFAGEAALLEVAAS